MRPRQATVYALVRGQRLGSPRGRARCCWPTPTASTEAMSTSDEEWGAQRLAQALRACDGLTADRAVERLIAEADAFAAGAPQHDDMTLLVVRAQEA